MVITAGVLGGVNYWMWSGKDDDAAGTKLTGSFMGFGGGAFVKVSGLIPYISPRVDVQYGTVDDKVSGKQVKITGITANLNLIYDIQTSGKIAPYVGVGGGGAMLNEKKPTTPNGADGNRFAINFVAGAAFQVNPKLSVGLDLGFVYDIDGQNNYVPIHVVVGYEF
jgi:opacity protein-like surface antigen